MPLTFASFAIAPLSSIGVPALQTPFVKDAVAIVTGTKSSPPSNLFKISGC